MDFSQCYFYDYDCDPAVIYAAHILGPRGDTASSYALWKASRVAGIFVPSTPHFLLPLSPFSFRC